MVKPKVIVCCISSTEEAELAIKNGADLIGLVGKMPSGPGVISDNKIKEIAAAVKGRVETVLLTSETSVKGIIAHHKRVETSCIQLVDKLTMGTHKQLKEGLPNIKIIQVIHVNDDTAIDEVKKLEEEVDYILLDSGRPKAKTKILGGTGQTHDWSISAQIVKLSSIPIFLAGGLSAKNISAALRTVKPFGVDLCSGIRTEGKLNLEKLDDFFCQVRNSY